MLNRPNETLLSDTGLQYLWFLENLDKVNRAIQATSDLNQMMSAVLDTLLEIFGCDRAWLVYPCDPTAATWQVPMERTRPEYPGVLPIGVELPLDPVGAGIFRITLAAHGPVKFGPEAEHAVPAIMANIFHIQSMLILTLYPKVGKPWNFGFHQCSRARVWTAPEVRLFQEIGRRIGDALSTLLSYRNLQENEARFRTFVEHGVDAFFLHDSAGNILDVNQQACESLGYTREELIGMNPAAFDADMTAELLADINARLLAGELITVDTHHRRKDGSIFPVEVRVRPVVGTSKAHSLSLARDMSERKRTQEALSLFRSLMDHITDGIEIIDPVTGRFLDVNEQACRAHGYTRAEYLNLFVFDICPELSAGSWASHQAVNPPSGQFIRESIHRRKDGSVFPVEVNISRVYLDRAYEIAVVRDITERKQTEQALVESHNLLNAVFEGASDAIFVKDLQGRYLMANRASARYLAKPISDVIGKTDREIFAPDMAQITIEQDRQVSLSGTPLTFEFTVPTADGERIFLSTKSNYRDAYGQIIGIIEITRDITELKRLEEQFRQAQKMEAVGQLAGGIAHDFNNLLTVINGYSGLIYSRLPTHDPNRKRLAEVQKAGERAANLVRQLLVFSRKQVLQPKLVNLNTLLSELLQLLRRLISEDIELILRPDATSGLTRIDPGQFEQAIINLVVNARDAMPQGGQLVISTCEVELNNSTVHYYPEVKSGHYVRVTVQDSGVGIDDQLKERIFEPFFTTKEPGKGTGLGLAMVYGFVKQSEGHIEVESTVGHGTTFKLYLPQVTETPAVPPVQTQPSSVLPGTETILLVEDESAVRQLFVQTLRANGYTVLEAGNGEEAIAIAQSYPDPIHLLVTDLIMPRLSGRQLADHLTQARPQLRVIFISGYTDEAVLRHGVIAGNVVLLQKPFDPVALLSKLREVLNAA